MTTNGPHHITNVLITTKYGRPKPRPNVSIHTVLTQDISHCWFIRSRRHYFLKSGLKMSIHWERTIRTSELLLSWVTYCSNCWIPPSMIVPRQNCGTILGNLRQQEFMVWWINLRLLEVDLFMIWFFFLFFIPLGSPTCKV